MQLKRREGILFYAVFFADFGDREHVFMPVRDHNARLLQVLSERRPPTNSEATEMDPETAGGILFYHSRRTEACGGVRGWPDPRRDVEARRSGLFEVKESLSQLLFSF